MCYVRVYVCSSGIERAKMGIPKVVLTFDLDVNGILKVCVYVYVCVMYVCMYL